MVLFFSQGLYICQHKFYHSFLFTQETSMKKLLTLSLFTLLGTVLWASALNTTPANPFQDDLSRFDEEFSGMAQLEQLADARQASYTVLAAEQNSLLNHVTSDNNIAASLLGSVAPDGETLMGIPSFWWGFCLGLIWVLLIYTAIEGDAQKREGKKAMLGCLIGTVVGCGIYFLIVALAVGNTP